MGQLTLTLPKTGRLDLEIAFDAATAVWNYFLIGAGDDIVILDDNGVIGFDDLGTTTLPSGLVARSFRSDVEIPLGIAPTHSFALYSTDATARRLISRLPVVGVDGLRLSEADNGTLIGEVFVYL